MLVTVLLLAGAQSCTWISVANQTLDKSFLLEINEGITTAGDDSHWILTGHAAMLKVDLTLDIVKRNDFPIPQHMMIVGGYNHIGDPAFHDGLIYAPIEQTAFQNGSVFVYNADSLELEDFFFVNQRHFPWIAIADSVMWSSEFKNVDVLFGYDLKGNRKSLVKLSRTLQDVQGGAFWTGLLYLTLNPPSSAVVSVNLTTGVVQDVIPTIEPELEGIAFIDLSSQGLGQMHLLNGHSWEGPSLASTLFHFSCE